MNKIVLLAFVSVLLITALVSARSVITVSGATTHHVYAGQWIQDAIDSAQSGDTIIVHVGTYYECVTIDKSLSLIGEDVHSTIIDGEGEGNVINIGANNVVVQNLTVRNSGPEYSSAGISIENDGASDMVARARHALISGNTITNNARGITFFYTYDNIVLENNITSNAANGILLYCSSNNTISRNNITMNQQNGIQFSESWNNNVSENNIENNGDYGIGFYTTSSDNTITRNNFIKNKYGIYLKQAYNNKFCHNTFTNNLKHVYAEPPLYGIVSANTWDDGYPSGGNYWSDYTGVDSDHDGIGNTPYVIDENNQDNYPLMIPWGLVKEEEEVPFWMQWWFYVIVAAIIVAFAGTVYFLKKKKPQTPTAPPLPTEGT